MNRGSTGQSAILQDHEAIEATQEHGATGRSKVFLLDGPNKYP